MNISKKIYNNIYNFFYRNKIHHDDIKKMEHKLSSEITRLYTELTRNLRRSPFSNSRSASLPEFKKAMESEDFPERFFALTKNLDEQSRATVVSILTRLQNSFKNPKLHWDIYTQKEKEIHQDMRDNFYGQILELSKEKFVYKNYILPKKQFDSGVFYFKYGLSEIKNINMTIEKDIIDAGSYIGDSLLLLSPLTNKNVHCFEVHPDNYHDLQTTILYNKILNVKINNTALADKIGSIIIRGSSDNLPAVTTKDIPRFLPDEKRKHLEFEISVPMQTLDQYVVDNNLDIGLIKVDIEGGEPAFLCGAINTIKTMRPILLISIYHYPDDFFDIKPTLESWDLGYTFKIVPGSENILSGTLLIADPSE